MRLFRTWLVGLGAGVLLAAGLALAGDPAIDYPLCNRTPSSSELDGAKGAHKAATQFYERADYERAIQYWKDAYRFDCTAHGVLINIANAYEKKGDRFEAVKALEAYLARTPDASDAVTIQTKIENLRNSLRSTPPAPPVTSQSAPVPVRPPPPVPTASSSASSRAVPPPPPEAPYGFTPWVVAGAGIVPLVAGGILTSSGLSAIEDAEQTCPERKGCNPDVAEKGNNGRTQATVGGVLLGLGAAGIAGGLIWQFVFNTPVAAPSATPDASVHVTPTAGPGYSGVGVSGRF
jgi:tetratricopeptide (TPR) repeat protein